MPAFPRLALVALALLLAAPAARADDAGDVRATIGAQLDAFRARDGAGASAHAAPNVRRIFPDEATFMSMVQQGYDPVFNAASRSFGAFRAEGAGFRQEVFLTDAEGWSWVASYTLERQPDGSMRITGCSLTRSPDVTA